jgi:hypothetical protein
MSNRYRNIKKKNIGIMIDDLFIRTNHTYPPNNIKIFEEYFYDKFTNLHTERDYIPILWTNLYIDRNYGKNDMCDIQIFLDNLDRTKKYFTIVQYDDNILNDLSDLDILIFSQGGYGKYKDKCYIIPLNCMPPNEIIINEKTIFASFIGYINNRHIIREKMAKTLGSKYFISESTNYSNFRDVMSRSTFSLCPRGYGQTSFRICESLQVESIPVYIYDDPLIPFKNEFNFSDIGILIHEEDISNIDNILSSKTKYDIDKYVENGRNIYREYFSYEGCYKTIINILNNEDKLYYLHSKKN